MTKIQLGASRRIPQSGPLGEPPTLAETEPIRVHQEDGGWQVDYGSYVQGHHANREEAIKAAMTAAVYENRELTIERPRKISETAQTAVEPAVS
jgi:hypothetical protein